MYDDQPPHEHRRWYCVNSVSLQFNPAGGDALSAPAAAAAVPAEGAAAPAAAEPGGIAAWTNIGKAEVQASVASGDVVLVDIRTATVTHAPAPTPSLALQKRVRPAMPPKVFNQVSDAV